MSSRMRSRARARTAGLSLIEVMVSAAILSLLALVLMSANVPLTRTANEAGVVFDMDRGASRFMTQVQRELRQSGYNQAAAQFSSTLPLIFRRRIAFGDVVGDTLTGNCWSPMVRYRLDGTTIRRSEWTGPGLVPTTVRVPEASVLENVAEWAVELIEGPDSTPGTPIYVSAEVRLMLRRQNPNWRGTNATADQQFLVRRYTEVIEFMNNRQQP